MKIAKILEVLQTELPNWEVPAAKGCAYAYERTPYTILISVMLSYKTKDEITCKAANRLLSFANTPQKIAALSVETIADRIKGVGFYNQKARQIKRMSLELLERFGGVVPSTLEELTSLPGVGVKAAKIVLEKAYNQPVVAVDSHVHRILNRWGVVHTRNALQTDRELENLLPDEMKRGFNRTLVAFGQAICKPLKPDCEVCPIKDLVECST